MKNRIETLRQKASALPPTPGVYLMKNGDGEIIYVGKSRHLCNRVSSYFTGNRHNLKTRRLVAQIRDFDTIVCDTEMEALSLENTLIKRHKPKYNIKLKDSKSYPYIKMTEEAFPRLYVTRQRVGGGRYFGPYPGAQDARSNMETVTKAFGLVACRHRFPEEIGKVRPCLYRQMHRCQAPCAGDISMKDYRVLADRAAEVLEGNVRGIKEELKQEMLRLSDSEQYEAAARVRDRMLALDSLGTRQKVVGVPGENVDVWGMMTSDICGALAVLTVRDGSLILKNEFTFPRTEILNEETAISFIADYYGDKGTCPRSVLLGFSPTGEQIDLLSTFLAQFQKYSVSVAIPQRGEKSRLCDLANKNAEEAGENLSSKTMREDKALARLSFLLSLDALPERVEAYDISNLGAECTTASMVVWEDGRLAKNRYRFFRIKEHSQDDYGSMREALHRRFTHEGKEFGTLPDLLLLDGGMQHVHVGKEVLKELGLSIPIFGMVKDDFHKTRALTDGEGEISIAHEQDVYTFVYNLQEEAHRFAVSRMMNAKRKTLKHSSLEDIPGIGPGRAKILLKEFTLKQLSRASLAEIQSVKGITAPAASAVYAHFHPQEPTP